MIMQFRKVITCGEATLGGGMREASRDTGSLLYSDTGSSYKNVFTF